LASQQGTPPDAVYTFKRALVQDGAYDSLLRRAKAGFRGKIAKAIEELGRTPRQPNPSCWRTTTPQGARLRTA
jgi:hypothetical protein